MKDIFLYKIADKIVDKIIKISADDSKYIYDPEHKKNPGGGFYKTKSGWSNKKKNKSNDESINDESKKQEENSSKNDVIKNNLKFTISSFQKKYLEKFYKDGSFNAKDYIYSMETFSAARKPIEKKYADKIGTKIEEKINWFSGGGYGESSNAIELANLAAWHFNLGKGDYRTNGVLGEKPDDELLEQYSQYLQKEQEILKQSGLVTKDGKVRLYRNVGKSLFKYHDSDDPIQYNTYKDHIGATMEYRGSHIESWTFKPDLSWDGAKIYAEVPLEACIASFIGRSGCGNSFQHMHERECMICSSLIDEVKLVGSDSWCEESVKNKYFEEIQNDLGENVEDFENHIQPASPQEMAEYQELKHSKDPKERIKAIHHKLCNSKELESMVVDEDPNVQYEIALSPKVTGKALDYLADSEYELVQNAILYHPHLPFSIVEKLSKSKFDSVSEQAKKQIELKKKKDKEKILGATSESEVKEYTQSENADPEILDALYDKFKDSTTKFPDSYIKKHIADCPKTSSETLKKIVDNESNIHILKAVVDNPNTTSEIIDNIVDGKFSEDWKKTMTAPPEKLQKSIAINPNSSAKALNWVVDWSSTDTDVLEKVAEHKNINDECANKLVEKDLHTANQLLSANHSVSGDVLEKLVYNKNIGGITYKNISEHPNATIKSLKKVSENAKNNSTKEHATKRLEKKLMEVSEKISDEEPTPKDIQMLKQYFPESCKNKTPEELIILFKTLAKRGYFSTGGGAVVVNPNNQNDEINQQNVDETDDDNEVLDYLNNFMNGEESNSAKEILDFLGVK